MFVTHDLELAAAVCDRIAVMYAGFLVEDEASGHPARDASSIPYTVGLHGRAAEPDGARRKALQRSPGRPLSAFEVEQGCPFGSRCAFAEELCREKRPALRGVDGGQVRCHRAEELRGRRGLRGGTGMRGAARCVAARHRPGAMPAVPRGRGLDQGLRGARRQRRGRGSRRRVVRHRRPAARSLWSASRARARRPQRG